MTAPFGNRRFIPEDLRGKTCYCIDEADYKE